MITASLVEKWHVLRFYRWELLLALGWVAAFFLARQTGRVPELFWGSVCIWAVLGVLGALGDLQSVVRQAERDRAAELALAVTVPPGLPEREHRRLWELQVRIARTIRGEESPAGEVRHG